ncbi:MAG: VOC family protein [Saprospiraceae bacterium]|nr:VOC family protein [Saprospiraceae bacterium]
MNNSPLFSWVEIACSDLDRATKFYEQMLGLELIPVDMDNGLRMRMFPDSEALTSGALCHQPNHYQPSMNGTLIYFNANPNLQIYLERIVQAGGEILQEKTMISPEHGYMAIFKDSEGNRMALHSIS